MGYLKRVTIGVLLIIGLLGYYLMAYHILRSEHLVLFSNYTLLFVLGILLTVVLAKRKKAWLILFLSGLLFRLIFLFASPQLSDDYFRFTWDGELQKIGESAFSFVPNDFRAHFEDDSLNARKFKELYTANSEAFPDGMNSKRYHSIYPPVNQLVFTIASYLGSPNYGNLIVIRLLIVLMEVFTFFMLRRLLMAQHRAAWLTGFYWLNPLVIIELTGNLHFEGFAVGFLLLSLYFLSQQKTNTAGFALALAISSKINPIFMLGAVYKHMSLKKFIPFTLITLTLTCIGFALILDSETFWNFKNSFGLYFTWFEFNTGFFYGYRELCFFLFDTDISSKISLIFPALTVLLFLWVCFSKDKKDIYQRLLLLYVIYLSFTPVVHPWYIIMLIPLAILSNKLYPLLWSFLVFFTYIAYGEPYGESYGVIGIEYGLVFLLMYFEFKGNYSVVNRVKNHLFGTLYIKNDATL